jgi:hypothetical protein
MPLSALLLTLIFSESLVLFHLSMKNGISYGECCLSLLRTDDVLLYISYRSVAVAL